MWNRTRVWRKIFLRHLKNKKNLKKKKLSLLGLLAKIKCKKKETN